MRVLDAKVPTGRTSSNARRSSPSTSTTTSTCALRAVQRGLDALGIEHELAPRLVRGFDYYTSTTFEFASDALDAAQNALGGGGRYDGLAEEMGGPPTPGIGFGHRHRAAAARVRRRAASDGAAPEPALDVFVVDVLGDGRGHRCCSHELREAGLRADRAYGGRSVKAQMEGGRPVGRGVRA